MSATQQTLAQLIRSKYPDSYKDMNDTDLEAAVVKKYPQYSDLPRSTQVMPPAPKATIGPDTRGTFQRLNDWWTNRPSYEGTLSSPGRSPREKAQAIAQGVGVASTPLLGAGLVSAPAATLLGLGGGVAGGYAGSKLGRLAGEQVGAPELGEDVGGAAGSTLGGLAGSKIPAAISATAPLLRYPATARQSQLGRPGTIKPILPALMQKYMIPDWMIPEGELGSTTKPGPFGEVPVRMPKAQSPPKEVDPVLQAVREGRAAKLPTRMPKQLEPPPSPSPSRFAGMTSSANPPPTALPPARTSVLGNQPTVEMVPKFTPPEQPTQSRIIQPGSEGAKPIHVEGSYWSFKEPQLRQAVMSGDRDAAAVYRQRFGELPPGAGYLTDVGQGPLRGLYRSTKP